MARHARRIASQQRKKPSPPPDSALAKCELRRDFTLIKPTWLVKT